MVMVSVLASKCATLFSSQFLPLNKTIKSLKNCYQHSMLSSYNVIRYDHEPQVNEVDSIGQTALFYAITHCQARVLFKGTVRQEKYAMGIIGKDFMQSPIARQGFFKGKCQERILCNDIARQRYQICNGNDIIHCQSRILSLCKGNLYYPTARLLK